MGRQKGCKTAMEKQAHQTSDKKTGVFAWFSIF